MCMYGLAVSFELMVHFMISENKITRRNKL